MKIRIAALLVGAMCCGCATTRTASIGVGFDRSQAEQLLAGGANTIKGSALIRQAGGGVVTCAGYPVYLIPATNYAKEWSRLLFGSRDGGYHSASIQAVKFSSLEPDFYRLIRSTKCDAQGAFIFENVALGDFYVKTDVVWEVPTRYSTSTQGGTLTKLVNVAGGQPTLVTLSP